MRTSLLLPVICGALAPAGVAQFTPEIIGFSDQNVISTEMDRAESVYAADLDGDGDFDVLSGSEGDDKIAWYENLGGGVFGPQQVIVQTVGGDQSVHADDLDGDGDMDVVWSSAGSGTDRIVWHRNLGGGSFAAGVDLPIVSASPRSLTTSDLDGDGDADVLVTFLGDDFENGQHAFFENLGGGSFGAQQAIEANVGVGLYISAADLDGDGDPDILATTGAPFLDEFVVYRNDGGLNFSAAATLPQPNDDFRVAQSIEAFDLDGDGDRDVLTTLSQPNGIYWHENLGGGSFGQRQTINVGVAGAMRALATDLDLDGDLDVVAGGFGSFDRLSWFENAGGGSFGPLLAIVPQNEPELLGLADIALADLDDDGDPDVLSASIFDDKIAWYSNWTASAVTFGQGCGAPAMDFTPTAVANLGGTLTARLEGARDLNLVHLGFSNSASAFGPLPLDLTFLGAPGCTLYAAPEVLNLPTTPTALPGTVEWTASIPAVPALEGLHLFVQAIGLSFTDPSQPIATSNGIDWQIAD